MMKELSHEELSQAKGGIPYEEPILIPLQAIIESGGGCVSGVLDTGGGCVDGIFNGFGGCCDGIWNSNNGGCVDGVRPAYPL